MDNEIKKVKINSSTDPYLIVPAYAIIDGEKQAIKTVNENYTGTTGGRLLTQIDLQTITENILGL